MDYIVFDRLCKTNGTTPTALALKLGLSKGNTTSWRKGGNPSAEILIKIADELNCTVDTLLGRNITSSYSNDENKLIYFFNQLNTHDKGKIIERAETLVEITAERAAQEAEKISKEKKKVAEKSEPVIVAPAADEASEQDGERLIEIRHSVYKVSAGYGFELDEGDNWETIEISDTPEARRADYALTISGDSMEPVYYDGDIVLVKMQDTVEIGQIGIFILDGSGYIKKYCGDHLVSLNEDYDDIPLSDYEDVRCSGRVIGRV